MSKEKDVLIEMTKEELGGDTSLPKDTHLKKPLAATGPISAWKALLSQPVWASSHTP